MNMPDRETRSSVDGIPCGDIIPRDQVRHPGGSAAPAEAPGEGGGYPDGCTTTEARSGDPRLRELRDSGLDRRWLAVAERIGVDRFFEAWRVLSEHTDEGQRLRVPKLDMWYRLERNEAIREWYQAGLEKRDIRRRVLRTYCERLSERHIARIIATSTIES